MRIVMQRVSSASVGVGGAEVARIGPGALLLVGILEGDGAPEVEAACSKVSALRVFGDRDGRMNLDIHQSGGEILLVSQFTLGADVSRGRRPSFDGLASRGRAEELIELLARQLRSAGVATKTGVFGARMEVSLVNEGPVTFVLDFPAAI